MSMAFSTRSMSMRTPRSLISWSMWYSSHTKSGTGKFRSFRWMDISTSTSRWLYFLNVAHLTGSSDGRFLVLPPFDFVGVQGTQKYLMSVLALRDLLLQRGSRTVPTPSNERGSPIVEAQTIEQRQLSGFRKRARSVDRGWPSWNGSRLRPLSRR
jgi:hypothetical protein